MDKEIKCNTSDAEKGGLHRSSFRPPLPPDLTMTSYKTLQVVKPDNQVQSAVNPCSMNPTHSKAVQNFINKPSSQQVTEDRPPARPMCIPPRFWDAMLKRDEWRNKNAQDCEPDPCSKILQGNHDCCPFYPESAYEPLPEINQFIESLPAGVINTPDTTKKPIDKYSILDIYSSIKGYEKICRPLCSPSPGKSPSTSKVTHQRWVPYPSPSESSNQILKHLPQFDEVTIKQKDGTFQHLIDLTVTTPTSIGVTLLEGGSLRVKACSEIEKTVSIPDYVNPSSLKCVILPGTSCLQITGEVGREASSVPESTGPAINIPVLPPPGSSQGQ